MPRQIWLLRHGDAEPQGTRPDFDRRLTEKGERQSRAAGLGLAAVGCEFASVWTSPRVRALETARIACEHLGCEPAVHKPLHAGFRTDGALELAAGEDPDASVLLIGHEPDFSQIVFDLTGARAAFKKGGVAGIELVAGGGRLMALLRPRDLAAIADA